MSDNNSITQVLDYWFADIGDGFDVQQQNKLWFMGGVAVDEEISRLFSEGVQRALRGELDHWSSTAQGMLALIVLLDQFPRNIYRGDSRAFDGDERAQRWVDRGLAQAMDQQLGYIQRLFFYMPLMHAEDVVQQQQGVECFQQLLADIPAAGKAIIQSSLDFAIKHQQIIQQFGRFPYRNVVLARESTAAEQAYLDRGGPRFGQ
ncbi:DUF924 family protein [Oceanicoccus sp. KOV_DT_Chl]|uniref:DUF924 family protein n=1 Tax=Oceanicoccus sp. KOV_DT_Chl TaxID=1904639 RepID=UPI000C7C6A3B|nr:DUF924 family protein [Oceanicoccus sp. KOV_DT_Chl]